MKRRIAVMNWALGMLVASFLLAGGCSEVDVTFHYGILTINHENYSAIRAVGEDTIDCAEIVGFDDQGRQIYGPVREPFSASVRRSDVPVKVKRVTVDYLRNCGYPLKVVSFSTDFEDDGVHAVSNPTIETHPTPTSAWTASVAPPGEQPVSSGAMGISAPNCPLKLDSACFKIKGMCYSPSPIKYDGGAFPALGDLFWDTFKPSDGNTTWNWYSLWGSGQLYDNFYARDDLATMRGLGVNALRVYAVMSRQPLANGNFPSEPAAGQRFTHQQFLDKCYNNGHDSIYVLIGLPTSDALFKKGINPKSGELKFWDYVVSETVQDVGSHPAVMGFTIMNELNAEPWSHVTGSTLGSSTSDQFYYKAIEYGNTIKTKAPGKLAGWAITDVPQLYKYAALAKFTAGPLKDKAYLDELAKVFSYWGVNTYQNTTLESVVGDQNVDKGYTLKQIPENDKRPVIFTEFGWPSTGRQGDVQSGAIMYNDTTTRRTADTITRMYGLAYGATYSDILAGAFYFEFSDEWWKSGQPTVWNATSTTPTEWNAMPNGWHDQEGFGLYASKKGPGKQNSDPIWCDSGPCLPQDELVPRMRVINALKAIFQ